MKAFVAFFAIAIFFAFGFYASWYSKEFPMDAYYTIPAKSSRDPAAIKKVYDFSHLQGSALDFAAKQRLIEGAKVVHDRQDVGVELGHFVVKGNDGQKQFACQHYSRIVLQFQGEGVAVAGELPQMEVEGACEISPDINSIAAVWIPVSKILGEPVSDGEFDFREGKLARLKFTNVSDQWPKMWQLRSVRLVDPSGAHSEVTIQTSELKEILDKPFLVTF